MATRLFGSQTSLREANRANLLASIHKFGAMTQVELAEVTGLSTATVSTLVHQLVDRYRLTDNYVCLNINTEFLHVLDLRLYDTLFRETELRDTVG